MGKSTLMNAFLGEKMSIITHKPQTTRHRILGIYNTEEFQIVFSDTPGLITDPNYKMQEAMNKAAFSIFEDADLVIFVTEPGEDYTGEEKVLNKLKKADVPKFLLINKVDLSNPEALLELKTKWESILDFDEIHFISALNKAGTDHVLECIKKRLPEGPVYFPKDQLSDKPERFFITEMIREKILLLYKQEIPYSCEVIIEEYKEENRNGKPFNRIRANIIAMRQSQKHILIGKGGSSIKKLGIEARKDIEKFLGHQIHLELYVKIKEKWRDDDRLLKSFGYLN